MKLPRANLVVVERSKIVDYLLNADHSQNKGKAAYYKSRGYSCKSWRCLATEIQLLAQTKHVTKSMETSHGMKYIVDGHIDSPSGKPMMVRTVWILPFKQNVPQFVTAVPVPLLMESVR